MPVAIRKLHRVENKKNLVFALPRSTLIDALSGLGIGNFFATATNEIIVHRREGYIVKLFRSVFALNIFPVFIGRK